MKTSILLTALAFALTAVPLASAEPGTIGSVVDVDQIKKVLGEGWKRDRGLLVENEQSINKLTGFEKQMSETVLGAVEEHGVTGFGDFAFSRTKAPFNRLNVQVFKFASAEEAAVYRKKKYETEEAKPLYKKTETETTITYDSLQVKKRIIFHGLFWITCGHSQKTDEHLKVLEKALKLEEPAAAKN